MTDVLLFPQLAFAFWVDRFRRLPGQALFGRIAPWISRALIAAAAVLTLLWAAEASPQRTTLADLAAGNLGSLQSWVIVSGDLVERPVTGSSLFHYELTDPAAPMAHLDVRSPVALPVGHVTISGHVEGGRDGVPAGYEWSARLNADDELANELPPPWAGILLFGAGILLILARRSTYPVFVGEEPADVEPTPGPFKVGAREDEGPGSRREVAGTLAFEAREPGTAELRVGSGRILPVRLHSAFTNVDVGRLRTLTGSKPALRVRSGHDRLTLTFASAFDRDATFTTLAAGAMARVPGRRA